MHTEITQELAKISITIQPIQLRSIIQGEKKITVKTCYLWENMFASNWKGGRNQVFVLKDKYNKKINCLLTQSFEHILNVYDFYDNCYDCIVTLYNT